MSVEYHFNFLLIFLLKIFHLLPLSSIISFQLPMEQHEGGGGLPPLKFRVYEYGTKPGEETTTTEQMPTAEETDIICTARYKWFNDGN